MSLLLIALVPFLAGLAFWIFAFLDCLLREPPAEPGKVKWLLIVFFGNILGAAAYLVMRRPQRIDLHGR